MRGGGSVFGRVTRAGSPPRREDLTLFASIVPLCTETLNLVIVNSREAGITIKSRKSALNAQEPLVGIGRLSNYMVCNWPSRKNVQ